MTQNTNTPLVVIQCITFNHEHYIEDALRGIVMQKTNFPFVAIVHDDASTDGTVAIVKRYAEQYPDIIHAILETENQYSKGTLGTVVNAAINNAGAKYVALCEGDDYWTDPNKLQMQVDFMECHPEYSMCFHDVDIKAEKGRDWYDVYGKLEDRDYDAFEDIYHWCMPTCSMLMRAEVYRARPVNPKFRMGDNVLVLTAGRMGKIRCIPRKMGVYRLTPTSWIGGQSNKTQRFKYISHYYGLLEEFESCRNEKMYDMMEGQYFELLTILKEEDDEQEFARVWDEYLHYPGTPHPDRFPVYYRRECLRHITKRLLGKRLSKVVGKIIH